MQPLKKDLEKKLNFKKNLIWLLLLLCIIAVMVVYYWILKPRISNEQIADYLRHPDKIPSQVLDNNNFDLIQWIQQHNPFYTNTKTKDTSDFNKNDSTIGQDVTISASEPQSNVIEIVDPIENTNIQQKQVIPEMQVVNLKDNAEVLINNNIDKKNIFIDSYKLSLYRNFLSEVQSMIINFVQDRSYQDELDKIKMFMNSCSDLNKITPIIEMFIEYNNKYLISPPQYKKSVIDEHKVINKFIKIEKDSPIVADKEKLKQEIYKNLHKLRNIIFSNETEQFFLNSNL